MHLSEPQHRCKQYVRGHKCAHECLTCKPDWEDEVGCWFVSVPVKENLQALLRLAGSKCGDNAAPALPFTLIDQGQVVIAPKHTSTPNPQMSLMQAGVVCCERSLLRQGVSLSNKHMPAQHSGAQSTKIYIST